MITHLDTDIVPEEGRVFLKARRHWFGIFTVCGLSLLALSLAVGLFIWLQQADSSSVGSSSDQVIAWELIIIAILVTLPLLGIITMLYISNQLVVTSEEVQQTIQEGLFHHRRSRLALANIEDVTFVKQGIFAQLFNYGDLSIETAGEQANFKFRHCPKPETCVQVIMEARERHFEDQTQGPRMRSLKR